MIKRVTSSILFRLSPLFALAVIVGLSGSCKKRDFNANDSGVSNADITQSRYQNPIQLSFEKFNRSDRSFNAFLHVYGEGTPPYDGKDLFCDNMNVRVIYLGSSEVVSAFDVRGLGILYCWKTREELMAHFSRVSFPYHSAKDVASKVVCSPGGDRSRVDCKRVEAYDRTGKTMPLFTGIMLYTAPDTSGPPYSTPKDTLKVGDKFPAIVEPWGLPDYKGTEIFCRNKELIAYDETRYVQDNFGYRAGIRNAVQCYMTREELVATFDKDIKAGSRVTCEKSPDPVDVTCSYLEEVTK